MTDINIWDHTENIEDGRLSYLTLACTTRCNLNCVYCSKKDFPRADIDPVLLTRALDEALDLGLQKVEFTGGEALLYPGFWQSVERLACAGVTVLLVTNGTLLTSETVKKLAGAGVGVSVSLSTLSEAHFDRMSQKKGMFPAVLKGLSLLRKAGYERDRMPMMSIQSIGSTETLHELETLRDFAHEQGALFILNRAIPVGGLEARNVPTGTQLKTFLDTEFDEGFRALVPFSSDSPCNRLKAGCYIGFDARIRPCPAIDLVAGDLREQGLGHIWKNSPILQDCRNIENLLEGACGVCPQKHRCYGCRAVAYAVWGSLSGPDPGCFRFVPDKKFNPTFCQTPQA